MKITRETIRKWIHRADVSSQIIHSHMHGPLAQKIKKAASTAQKLAGFKNALKSEVAKKVGKP